MNTFSTLMGVGLVVLAFLALWSLLIGLPTMWLWNWLMPVIFGLPTIGFWQSVGLVFLSGIFFKSNTTTQSK